MHYSFLNIIHEKNIQILLFLFFLFNSTRVFSSNGNDIIGAGSVSISLGGTGIAAPQDAVSAVIKNPAAICFGSNDRCSEFDISLTVGNPRAEAKIKMGDTTIKAKSDDKLHPTPAVGLTMPLVNTFPKWSIGVAAVGVSGIGVDYKNTEIDQPEFYDFGPSGKFPLIKGNFSQLQVTKFAPSIALQPTESISFGLSFHIDYASLDLGNGSSTDFALGGQVGILFKYSEHILLGATYTSPQMFTFKNVVDLDGDGSTDNLKLEKPQEIGFGIDLIPLKDILLFEVDIKWKNWADAKGYDELDWKNQWIIALGAQFKATNKLTLRTGYNYGANPISEHNNFEGTSLTEIQGKILPVYYYETFRIFGNPAVEEHHVSLGIEYDLKDWIAFNLVYTHIFKADIKESGKDLLGNPVSIESKVDGDALGVGITFRF